MSRLPGRSSVPKKYKSGAQKRREKAEREAVERADVEQRARALGMPVGHQAQAAAAGDHDADPPWAGEFREAGDPDLAEPGTDLDYVRKLQLISLRQMATTAYPTPEQEKLWRRIREMSAVVGMTSNRAQLEAEVKRLKQQLAEHRAKVGSARMVPGGSVALPATARNSGRARGPRPLPPDGPGAQAGQDG